MTQIRSRKMFVALLCMFIIFAMLVPAFGAKAEAAAKIHLSQTSAWMQTGDSIQLKLIDTKGKAITATKVTWSTSDKTIAKVSKKGKVTAIEDSFGGECKITAKYGGKKYTCKITAYEIAEETDLLKLSWADEENGFDVLNNEGFGGWGDISLSVMYDGQKVTDWTVEIEDVTLGTVEKTSKGLLKIVNLQQGDNTLTVHYQDKCASFNWHTTYACSKNITIGYFEYTVPAEGIEGGFGGATQCYCTVKYKGKATKNYTIKTIGEGPATFTKQKNGKLLIKCTENGDTRFEITCNGEKAVFRYHLDGLADDYLDAVIKWGKWDIAPGESFGQVGDELLDVYINGEKCTTFTVKSNHKDLVAENKDGKLHLQAPEGIGGLEFTISLNGKNATYIATSEGGN